MRTRRLFAIVAADHLKPGTSVLDFSPSRSIYRKLRALAGIQYVASDLAGEFLADEHYDLARLDIPDESFDAILCYHVLEHIEDDTAALSELFRVLRAGGVCLIQTPFRDGDIDEDWNVTTPAGRRERFGQEDHVRTYSIAGLADRVRQVGFDAVIRTFDEQPGNYHGFAPHETIVAAVKHRP